MSQRIVYGWKATRGFKVSAQVVGETLEQIEAKRGEITPRAVLDAAKPITSPLHSFFEWDNEKAAEGYRLDQARHLVSAIVVSAYAGEEQKTPTRAFVSVSDDDGRSYMGIATAMSDAETRAQVLEKAQQEIREWRNRYSALHEFSKLFSAIDKLAAKEPSRRRASRSAAASVGFG